MAPVQFGFAKLLTQVGSWLDDGGVEVLRPAFGCWVRRRGSVMSSAARVRERESRSAKTLVMSVVVVGMALPAVYQSRNG